jgi:N-acetylneuraminate lyase
MSLRIRGLVAAVHTPFDARGELNLAAVEAQAAHLHRDGAYGVFVGGTTGECASLTVDERHALAERWSAVLKGSALKLIVHVGANCLHDSAALAQHAATIDAAAVATVAPSYFKAKDVATLVDGLAMIAAAAPSVPFYYYDIPMLTHVTLSAYDVLERAERQIPNLNGIKFTNPDLFTYQRLLHLADGKFDCPYGIDEAFLAAMALGARGAVGSSYNFTLPLFHKILAELAGHDLPAAAHHQFAAVELIAMMNAYGYLPASKAVMGFVGVNVGPARLPLSPLSAEQREAMRSKWEAMADRIRLRAN